MPEDTRRKKQIGILSFRGCSFSGVLGVFGGIFSGGPELRAVFVVANFCQGIPGEEISGHCIRLGRSQT